MYLFTLQYNGPALINKAVWSNKIYTWSFMVLQIIKTNVTCSYIVQS